MFCLGNATGDEVRKAYRHLVIDSDDPFCLLQLNLTCNVVNPILGPNFHKRIIYFLRPSHLTMCSIEFLKFSVGRRRFNCTRTNAGN